MSKGGSVIMKKNGIDVSSHQCNINWGHVTADFAVIRAGYGRLASQKDSQFENNYAGCKSNNIPVGAYWYSYAVSESEAILEAKACLEVLKGKTFEFPIYFDIEEERQLRLGKEKCTAITRAFLETVENAGYWVGIYASKNVLENYLSADIRKRFAVWVAQYNSECTYKGDYGVWQHRSDGKMNGIAGNVDMDYCYVDYPAVIKKRGLNGFKRSDSIKPAEPIKTNTSSALKVGDKVKVKSGAKDYNGGSLAGFVYKTVYTVQQINNNRVVIGLDGAVTAAIHKDNLSKA